MYQYKKFAWILIFIGLIGFALITVFGEGTVTYLQKINIGYGKYLYKYDFNSYLYNLRMSANSTAELALEVPTREFNSDIVNNLQVISNYLILPINILLYPIRLGSYAVYNTLAVLGVNVIDPPQTGVTWLINLVRESIDMQISYY